MVRYLMVFLYLFLQLFSLEGWAQASNLKIISPQPGSTVTSGELFVSVSVSGGQTIKKNTVEVYLDGHLQTQNLKVSETNISFIYLKPLRKGKHRLIVFAQNNNKVWLPELDWTFKVLPSASPQTKADFTGSAIAETRREFISGPGANLRQEPRFTNSLSFQGQYSKNRNFNIPIQFRLTSDETNFSPGLLPRNYFRTGLETRWLAIHVGDINPRLDRLILNGTRIRGALLALYSRRFRLDLVRGNLRQGVEGRLERFTSNSTGLPPGKLRPDSTYVVSGIFKRTVSAAKITFGSEDRGAYLGLLFFKAKDDTGSIRYGTSPAENLALGLDHGMSTLANRLKIKAGVSVSFITEDISGGATTKAELDSVFNTDVPIKPEQYQDIFTINLSTIPYSRALTAAHVNANLNLKKQRITAEYRYTGSAYQSLGNPFMRKDQRIFSVNDRFQLFKQKLRFALSYRYATNNLSNSQSSTVLTHQFGGNVVINIKPKWPTFNLNFNQQDRSGRSRFGELYSTNDRFSNWAAGFQKSFSIKQVNYNTQIQYAEAKRDDLIRNQSTSLNRLLTVNLSQQLAIPLNLSFQHTTMWFRVPLIDNEFLNNLSSIQVRYNFKKIKLTPSIRLSHYETSLSSFSSAATRNSFIGGLTYDPVKTLNVTAEWGYTPFRDVNTPLNNYDESYLYVRLAYRFHKG